MPLKDTGDSIKGIGFVTLYFAHLEYGVDKLLSEIAAIGPIDHKQLRYGVKDKSRLLKKTLLKAMRSYPTKWKESDQRNIETTFRAVNRVIKKRNELLHLPIFANWGGGQFMLAKDGSEIDLTSEEVFRLANQIDRTNSKLHSLRFIVTRISNAMHK